mgnify:CR=1 FL=1
MSKPEDNETIFENTVTYVYLPDEGIYGTILRHGAWSSLIQYYDGGIGYTIEVPNDEFRVVDEIGIGYESGEDL